MVIKTAGETDKVAGEAKTPPQMRPNASPARSKSYSAKSSSNHKHIPSFSN